MPILTLVFRVILLTLFLLVPTAGYVQPTQHFYLSPIVGSGTEHDPYHSLCYGMPGGYNIDIRPDASLADGYMLCTSNALPADASKLIILANSRRGAINAGAKEAMRVGMQLADVAELRAASIDDLLPQLLIDLPTAKKGLWNPIEPGRDGKYHIYLGEELWQQTAWLYPYFRDHGLVADMWNAAQAGVAWAASLATETWNCADNPAISCVLTWTAIAGSAFDIVGEQASASGNASPSLYVASALDTTDTQASATVTNVTRGGTGTAAACYVLVYKEANSTRTWYHYGVRDRSTGDANHSVFGKAVAATYTDLQEQTDNWTANDIISLSKSGSSFIAKLAGNTKISTTDSSITGLTGNHVGIFYNSDASSGNCAMDNFNGSDYSASASRKRISPWFN